MVSALSPSRLARHRLAAQRLTPGSAATTPAEAARAVLGVQAQDTRAASLALRSRVPGLTRGAVAADRTILRTWTARGTAHLIAADDLPWIHALTGPRNARTYDNLMAKRGNLDTARALIPDIRSILAERSPISRAEILAELERRGRPTLGPYSVNVLMPYLAAHAIVAGLPDGTFRLADPIPHVPEDEALATLGRRYLAGYGPATPADLAKWSGLPLGTARRAFDAAGPLERAGHLLALPGGLDAEPPPAPPVLLLAAFDTAMLGWRTREPLVAPAHERRVLPGGGIVRPVLLGRGRAAATWRISGSGKRRRLELDRFGRAPSAAALAAEAADIARFLEIDLQPAS